MKTHKKSDVAARFRPPAVPLVVHDPYFSVWSFADELTSGWTRHWTGTNQGMCGLLRVDGKTFRFAGDSPGLPAAKQVSLEVLPTRTMYRFEAGGVELALTFMTPALPDDLDVLARPVTYVAFDARVLDGRAHRVQLSFDISADWSVDSPSQKVASSRFRLDGLSVLRTGSQDQRMLERAGDNLRIEWGHLYLAVPQQKGASDALAAAARGRSAFIQTGCLPAGDDIAEPAAVQEQWPALMAAFDLGVVRRGPAVSRHVIVAYDDRFALEHMHRRVRAYWRRNGQTVDGLLLTAAGEYAALARRCRAFDDELMADLRAAGGESYARLCALSYRQAIGAHKLAADFDGTLLFLSKENFSNGCIATVDVTYPSAPLFLALNPALLRGMVEPVLAYAAGPRWKFPFAPHDLGTDPLANGQVYGGGESSERSQMPVEECGNLLLLVAALQKVGGHDDLVGRYWPQLTTWARYLLERGYDPENQLCTDDFAGHLAHNANLSIKAILALGAYASLCLHMGHDAQAARYRQAAQRAVRRWVRDADDGDHARLAFDRPGTWSQKYNLVWDRLLGLDLFGQEVARREVAFYRRVQSDLGLPLDSRKTYTKGDWIVWSASLTGRREDFVALVEPLCRWCHTTPSRVPVTDLYETADGRQVGFQARSVVGGFFIGLLGNGRVWRKWVKRAKK